MPLTWAKICQAVSSHFLGMCLLLNGPQLNKRRLISVIIFNKSLRSVEKCKEHKSMCSVKIQNSLTGLPEIHFLGFFLHFFFPLSKLLVSKLVILGEKMSTENKTFKIYKFLLKSISFNENYRTRAINHHGFYSKIHTLLDLSHIFTG